MTLAARITVAIGCSLALFLSSCATATPEQARTWRRDAVAFAIPGVALTGAGLVAGAAEVGLGPRDPPWLRGASIGLLGAGVLCSIVAFTFHVLSTDAAERPPPPPKGTTLSDATHR